jgi:hypothetical protein
LQYRFVHAGDIHLDSTLRSLALRNPELVDLPAKVKSIEICRGAAGNQVAGSHLSLLEGFHVAMPGRTTPIMLITAFSDERS